MYIVFNAKYIPIIITTKTHIYNTNLKTLNYKYHRMFYFHY